MLQRLVVSLACSALVYLPATALAGKKKSKAAAAAVAQGPGATDVPNNGIDENCDGQP